MSDHNTLTNTVTHLHAARSVIQELGLPKAQRNERSALCLLALLNLTPERSWNKIENPLVGITPIMEWVGEHYGREYAPNSRETFRRQTMHQFCEAGIALYNPDDTTRPINSPKTVYQIEPETHKLLATFGTRKWKGSLAAYLKIRKTLVSRYAKERAQNQIPVKLASGKKIRLSPGPHSELIRAVVEDFAPRFAPEGELIYAGDTGKKWGYFDETLLEGLGVKLDAHGKMPDVVFYLRHRNWVLLIESVTSHGPVDGKRHDELRRLFAACKAGLVFITAFPDRATMGKYVRDLAWETEVWIAESPSHLIHFNGERFLGPY